MESAGGIAMATLNTEALVLLAGRLMMGGRGALRLRWHWLDSHVGLSVLLPM